MFDNLKCPECARALTDVKSSSVGFVIPTPGDLFLCGSCVTLSFYTPEGMELVTAEQFETLGPDEKRDLLFAVRDIRARHLQQKRTLRSVQAFLNANPQTPT